MPAQCPAGETVGGITGGQTTFTQSRQIAVTCPAGAGGAPVTTATAWTPPASSECAVPQNGGGQSQTCSVQCPVHCTLYKGGSAFHWTQLWLGGANCPTANTPTGNFSTGNSEPAFCYATAETYTYVMTADAAQGKTCDTMIAWVRSTQQHLASQDRFYVALSRARLGAEIVTDDARKLATRLDMNRGGNETALTPTAARAVVAQRTAGRERGADAGSERKVESVKSMIEVAHQRESVSTESARTQRDQVSREWGISR